MSSAGRIAAFFDLDGTLLAAPSLERRFLRYLLQRGALGPAQAFRWAAQFLRFVVRDFAAAALANKSHLAGVPLRLVLGWAASLKCKALPFYEEGLLRVRWHAGQGHRIYLVSGTLAPLARIVAAQFPVPVEICATELDSARGCWTGELADNWVSGEAKARAVARIALENGFDLFECFAYGDRMTDAAMLQLVGHPVAINPSLPLERLAVQRGWPALKWHKTTPTPENRRSMLISVRRPAAPRLSLAPGRRGQ